MIPVVLALVVGLLAGALLAYRFYDAAAVACSRRALQQLQGTLDGLETLYSIKVASYEAHRELSTISTLSADHPTPGVVHLPSRPAR